MNNKDESITNLLVKLRHRMGDNAFDVVDYWEGDLCATGLARPGNHSVLVYISTWQKEPGHYFVSLESSSVSGDNYPYACAGDIEVHSFDELVDVIERHFGSCSDISRANEHP